MRNFRTLYLVILFSISSSFVEAQHYLSSSTYNQNFNTIGSTDVVYDIATLPAGWSFKETGSFINNFYRVDNGAQGLGDTYSYGETGSVERAFGSMATAATTSQFGVTFINTTGKTITALTIGYTSEQWHAGAFNRNDTTLFHYQLGNSLWYGNNWNNIPQLNIITRPPSGAFQLNGNDPVNQQKFEYVIENISIAENDTFALRWTDIDIVSGNDDGVAIDDFFLIAHSEDVFSPHITSLSPSTGSSVTGTAFNGNIQFSEAVKKGTGKIRIARHPGSEEIDSIDVNDASVSVSGQQLTFSALNLAKEKDYQVLIDSTAITDLAGNSFRGIKTAEWTFNIVSDTDSQRPLIDTLFPSPGGSLATNYITFRMYLKEPIKKGNGKIYIKRSNDQVVQSFSVDSSAINISGNQLWFQSDFLNTGAYYISVDSGAVKDMANNNFAGIAKGRWTFGISTILGVPIDNHPLTINQVTPANASSSVNPNKLEIYWYEYALEQYGFINIRNYYTDNIVQQINVNSAAVTTSTNLSTINISPLPAGTYYVDIQPGVFVNIPGTEFLGTNKSTWRFTVAGDDHIPLKVVSTDPLNGATNMPTTGRIILRLNKFLQTPSDIAIRRYSDDVLVLNASTRVQDSLVVMDYGSSFFGLDYNTRYYADVSPGKIKDLGGFYTTESSFNKDAWSFTTALSVITAVDDVDVNEPHLTIFGNPASNHIMAKFSEHVIGKVKVEVFNNLGIMITQKAIGANGLIDIDTKGWKKGMYILKTTYGNKTVMNKVIVQ